MNKIYYVSVKGYPKSEGYARAIKAPSPGRAKAIYFNIINGNVDVSYTSMRVNTLKEWPKDSLKNFQSVAVYRDLPKAYLGMKVYYGPELKEAEICGAGGGGAHFQYITPEGHIFWDHPNWYCKYVDDKDQVVYNWVEGKAVHNLEEAA